ncbi:bifunctional UDP-N-acetylglucosamine diphosphorylase/glucosamine-1-phosphate N-acetyltransferase GlmU [Azospirillum sp. RWY-5-1]|uniref:Bifunctional protein GlmU n=1 Tax=Azospirillum oleiclasticum TaxID=2735135 RepID=A0ABX2THJ8_9PROT|nr:bifunctional UDP-N-acetylglucosamine diphosphorylase/glucosamine-1-phosphate N-acetyltransferase GlmU [Azospirillum oleiclasticum]NYZ15014.1 bifunctional UDP-N-acetylglucosamine diphosphorylase/glucosamine-1-phosphate N-acetyltransferase GlmU [Azospirillum oleiclasticum]NYZ22776.1 bifunctional UDP-N-acetylglucosamine diphosphorylase/glucosamine-1-phosphate N-acetyltransferase GlmU [Azospirillum oleiclasticum]
MNHRPLACVILAAGKGSRMKSDLPKVLHKVAGRPMIGHVLATVRELDPDHVVVVVGPGMEDVAAVVHPYPTAVQERQQGTADAVRSAFGLLEGFRGDVVVLYGDTPLVTPDTLRAMIQARRQPSDPAVVVLGMRPDDPGAYGRLILNARGGLEKIVEYLDATEDERRVTLCNAGLMAFDGARMTGLINRIGNSNAKGEFYLTDVVQIARSESMPCAVVEAAPAEVMGVNSREELAEAERVVQRRLRKAAMDNGATLTDPNTVTFSHDTRLGRDVTVAPYVVFGPGVSVADRVEIKSFCHLEQVRIDSGAIIGPYARLRPGAEIGPDVHIGNFVEVKNARIEAGAKVNHLTYIGDARVGAKANVGAGTITCNYDGFNKHRTDIGAGAFIGSNTALVAPVKVGDGAMIAAGSVITRDVEADAMAVARGKQASHAGWAGRFRAVKAEEKARKR